MGCEDSRLFNMHAGDNKNRTLNLDFNRFIKGNSGNFHLSYQLGAFLYQGISTNVREAVQLRTKQKRVVKIYKRSIVTMKKAIHQINALKKMDHPNIIKVFQYFMDDDLVYMVFEKFEGVQLNKLLLDSSQPSFKKKVTSIFQQILAAIAYCHSKGIAHNNICPENILVYSKADIIFIKIVGLSKAVDFQKLYSEEDKENKLCEVGVGTLREIKDESGVADRVKIDYEKEDIRNIGFLMFSILSARSFSKLKAQQNKVLKILQKWVKKTGQVSANILISDMLNQNAQDRPRAENCLEYPFFLKTSFSESSKVGEQLRMAKISSPQFEDYKNEKRMKNLLQMYITYRMGNTEEQMQYMVQFQSMDADNNGMLQEQQVVQCLVESFGLSQEKAVLCTKQIFEKYDKNANGVIQFSQYLLGTMNISKILNQEKIKDLFNDIDINGDGYITQNQLQTLVQDYNDKTSILNDKRKRIDFKEFKEIINQIVNHRNKRISPDQVQDRNVSSQQEQLKITSGLVQQNIQYDLIPVKPINKNRL